MQYKKIAMAPRKKIAPVAHDNKKQDLFEWVKFNRELLAHHDLYATGTTGTILGEELDLEIVKLESGPLGGDQQIGAKIAMGEIDFVIFSGIRWSRCHTIQTSRRCCVSRWYGTYPLQSIFREMAGANLCGSSIPSLVMATALTGTSGFRHTQLEGRRTLRLSSEFHFLWGDHYVRSNSSVRVGWEWLKR